ncbi:MAG: hypothetical protein AAB304_09200, partial [Pseudomonadota bacterium]
MSKSLIPTPKDQDIPAAENLFKALFLLTLLFVSFALTKRGVSAMAAGAVEALVGAWRAAVASSLASRAAV